MFRIGDNLREARLRRGLELAEVEQRTKIRARLLAALEEERFELLPGEAYAKGFLRTYAETLGLDSQPFLDEFNERVAGRDDHDSDLVAALAPAEVRGRRLPRPPLSVLVAGAAAVLSAILLAATLHQGGSKQPTRSAHVRAGAVAAAVPRQSRPHPSRTSRRAPHRELRLMPARLEAVAAWDPDGDRHEHDAEIARATDGDPATHWRTETYYAGLQKPGVGLVLASPGPIRLARLTVVTDTPGFTAVVEAAASHGGPFAPVSRSGVVGRTTSFVLGRRSARFYLVWITRLQRVAHVDEVHAFRAVASERSALAR